jgi:hypothetical protein
MWDRGTGQCFSKLAYSGPKIRVIWSCFGASILSVNLQYGTYIVRGRLTGRSHTLHSPMGGGLSFNFSLSLKLELVGIMSLSSSTLTYRGGAGTISADENCRYIETYMNPAMVVDSTDPGTSFPPLATRSEEQSSQYHRERLFATFSPNERRLRHVALVHMVYTLQRRTSFALHP